jgi:hypothetical protein
MLKRRYGGHADVRIATDLAQAQRVEAKESMES